MRAEIYTAKHHGARANVFDPASLQGSCHACHNHKHRSKIKGLWIETRHSRPSSEFKEGVWGSISRNRSPASGWRCFSRFRNKSFFWGSTILKISSLQPHSNNANRAAPIATEGASAFAEGIRCRPFHPAELSRATSSAINPETFRGPIREAGLSRNRSGCHRARNRTSRQTG